MSDGRRCTSSLLGARACVTGLSLSVSHSLSLSPLLSRPCTNTHRSQNPPQCFTGGRFPQGGKVLDARIDRLTAEYSIVEFSGRFLLTPKHTKQQPIAKSSRAPTLFLLCRPFSQRLLVPHVCICVRVCGCVGVHLCACVRICEYSVCMVCVCVCVMSRMGLVSPNTLSHRTISILSALCQALALPSCRYAE